MAIVAEITGIDTEKLGNENEGDNSKK